MDLLVVGVQDSSDGLGVLTLLDGPIVVSGVERLKVEASLGLCGPETDVVGVDGVVARDGAVVGHGKDLEAVGPSVRARCVSIGFAVEPGHTSLRQDGQFTCRIAALT